MQMVVDGLIRQLIRPAVFFAPDMTYGKGGEFGQLLPGLLEKRDKIGVLDPVFSQDLPDDEFGIKVDFYPAPAKVAAFFQPEQQGFILSFVVGALPKIFSFSEKFNALTVHYSYSRPGLSRIAP